MSHQTIVGPDISRITDLLYISAFPEAEHAETIRALDVRLILSMPIQRPHHQVRMPPVRWMHLPTVDSPLVPMPMPLLRRGVEAALPVMEDGHAVLVHCLAGVHRSVAMACCILIGQGYTAEEAMTLVEQQRAVADPRAWWIRRRIEKFERSWRRRHPATPDSPGGTPDIPEG